MITKGEYDTVAQVVWDVTEGAGLLLLVMNGNRGTGYSAKGPLDLIAELPVILREIADELERPPAAVDARIAELFVDDAREWGSGGHPCRGCGELAGAHPTDLCDGWR